MLKWESVYSYLKHPTDGHASKCGVVRITDCKNLHMQLYSMCLYSWVEASVKDNIIQFGVEHVTNGTPPIFKAFINLEGNQ